jgi:hypothetical protein
MQRDGRHVRHDGALGSGKEAKQGTVFANRVQDGRAFGGRLTVADRRLTFAPLALSQARGGRSWAVDLQEVLGADVSSRAWRLRDGSARHRLQVRTQVGEAQYFVVWWPRRMAKMINRARNAAR